MDVILNSPTPTVQHVFHAPELWVLLQTLGVIMPGVEVPPEIASGPGGIQTAEAALLSLGALSIDATGTKSLNPELEAVILTAVFPNHVFIVNIADNARFGSFARVMCFGWTPEALVVNWVDESGDHHFESYEPLKAQACVWGYLSRLCQLDVDDPDPAWAGLTPEELEQRADQMRQSVMVMAVTGLQRPRQSTQILSWFVSGRSAWFMEQDDRSGPLSVGLAARADIAQAVFAFVSHALISGQRVSAG